MWCAIIFVFELYCIVCHHQCLGNTLGMHRPIMYDTNQLFITKYDIWNAWKYFSSRSKGYLRLVYLWFQFNCLLIRRLTRLTANNLTDTQSNTQPLKHSTYCVLHSQQRQIFKVMWETRKSWNPFMPLVRIWICSGFSITSDENVALQIY